MYSAFVMSQLYCAQQVFVFDRNSYFFHTPRLRFMQSEDLKHKASKGEIISCQLSDVNWFGE